MIIEHQTTLKDNIAKPDVKTSLCSSSSSSTKIGSAVIWKFHKKSENLRK